MAFGTIGTVGGSASGVWSNTPEAASLDGLMSLEKQDSAPAHTSGYVKLYTKEVAGGGGPEMLLRFNDDVVDEMENHTCVATGLGSYIESGAGYPAGGIEAFDKAAYIDGSASIAFPDLGIGTADFSMSFWISFVSHGQPQAMIAFETADVPNNPTSDYLILYTGSGNQLLLQNSASPADKVVFTVDWTRAYLTWQHYILTREAVGGGDSQHHLYFGDPALGTGTGARLPFYSGDGIWTTDDIKSGTIGSFGPTAFYGQFYMDEFTIYKSLIEEDTTYTIPTAPNSAGGGAGGTELFVKDSAGNETQIS